MAILMDQVQKRKQFIVKRLIQSGHSKAEDHKKLLDSTLTELERMYIDMACNLGREISMDIEV
jgi:hypothetical protein